VSAICNTDQKRANSARSYAVNFVTAPSTTPACSVIVSARYLTKKRTVMSSVNTTTMTFANIGLSRPTSRM
jgi:hypothetical protein